MHDTERDELLKNCNDRLSNVEQILPTLATKEDLKAFATKEDLKAHPTREEMRAAIREEGQLTRQHFNVVAERIEESVKLIAEGHGELDKRVTRIEKATGLR